MKRRFLPLLLCLLLIATIIPTMLSAAQAERVEPTKAVQPTETVQPISDKEVEHTSKEETDHTEVAEPVTYPVLEGAQATWKTGSGGGLTVRFDAPFSQFRVLKVNGIPLAASDYTVAEGSTVVTLQPAFLATLPVGTHTLRAEFEFGVGEASFLVAESDDAVDVSTIELPFTDIQSSDEFYRDIAYIYAKKLMLGTSDTTFAPTVRANRGMIVTVLYRAAGSPLVQAPVLFPDVKTGSYYEKPISWAAGMGIVRGFEDGTYRPDDEITREQLISILYRYAQKMGHDVSAEADLATLADASDISIFAKQAVAWAVNAELIVPEKGQLDPEMPVSRAGMATILRRFLELIAQ